MKQQGQPSELKFEVDKANMYKDEGYTDLKSASIRKLTPINIDGSVDDSRRCLFFGHAELISPQGPIPVQAELNAEDLEGAIAALPAAMEKAAADVKADYNKMVQQQMAQQENKSKIIKSTD